MEEGKMMYKCAVCGMETEEKGEGKCGCGGNLDEMHVCDCAGGGHSEECCNAK